MAQLKNTTIDDTGFLRLPRGSTAQRPASPENGQVRFNTDTASPEWYDSTYSRWFPVGTTRPIATGGTITNISIGGANFRVHSFTTSGTFTVTRGGEIEYLIVGGGGAGADTGGGGAGGVLLGRIIVTPQAYGIVIGAATANSADGSTPGIQGNSTHALGMVAYGGGGAGGGFGDGRALSGGSGGGGGRNPGGGILEFGAPGIPNQGNRGGDFSNSGDWEAGGGGGAGCAGRNAVYSDWAGDGGHGVGVLITGSVQFYGGGGGGGSNTQRGRGGLGGGGQGKLNADDTNYNGGTNTGGGGGGGWSGICGLGGSGIVIIRYRTN